MGTLTSIDKQKFEKLLGMDNGYVLDFSNRTFEEFFRDNSLIEIYDSKYDYASGSKANRLRAFWNIEDRIKVGNLLKSLLERWKLNKTINNQLTTFPENDLYEQCSLIADELINPRTKKDQKTNSKQQNIEFELNKLLLVFDDLGKSNYKQQRGYFLQKLLSDLLELQKITTIKCFRRNEGGEQIDGAFSMNGWYYLVECKWTNKLADIKELDSLLGKVYRSGKQTLGLFLSIEGWSLNIPSLLKQNPEKCILLMDGYDLRCTLSGLISIEQLMLEKSAKLNLDTEPFLSAVDILKTKFNNL